MSYKGEFENGVKSGAGLEKYLNGDVYEGQFVNDLKEGYGVLKTKD